jgi:hypothetical protein
MKMKISFLVIAGVFLLLIPPSLVHGKRDPKDLVLYIPFDEGRGKTATDISDFENHGKLEGNWEWDDGKFGKAIRFSINDPGMVRTPADKVFAFEGGDEITIMAWVSMDVARPGARGILYNSPDGNKANYALRLETVDPSFFYRDKGDQDFHRVTGIWDSVPIDTWTHIAATNTFGNAEAMKIYLNGKNQKSSRDGGVNKGHEAKDWSKGDGTKPPLPANGPITIGGYGAFGEPFQGAIDEVMIWKVAFTEEEIQAIMLAPGDQFLGVEPHQKLATKWGAIKQNP